MSNTHKPFGLRLPPEVKNWLVVRASGNERSMNAEMVNILKNLMKAEVETPSDGSTASERGTPERVARTK